MKIEKKITIEFDQNEENVIKDFENLLDKVCTKINMKNCAEGCPFYKLCQQKYAIKESFQTMIDNASDIYNEDDYKA